MEVGHRLAPRGQVDFRDVRRVTRFSLADFETLNHPHRLRAHGRGYSPSSRRKTRSTGIRAARVAFILRQERTGALF
jgi:hypothetical protein